MILGTGIDIVELERIKRAKEKNQRFVNRILTENEQFTYQQLSERRKIEYLAGRFSTKEAFAKAIGTGIGKQLSWHDMEVYQDEYGKPILKTKKEYGLIHLSISHSREYVVANVIIESL